MRRRRPALTEYQRSFESAQFRKAAAQLRALWSLGNAYLEHKAPWLEIREDPDAAALTLRTAMNLVALYGIVSEPLIPGAAHTMSELWEFPGGSTLPRWPDTGDIETMSWIRPGTRFRVLDVLFRKITDEDVTAWRAQFGAEPAVNA